MVPIRVVPGLGGPRPRWCSPIRPVSSVYNRVNKSQPDPTTRLARRHDAGSTSARGILLTVMGELILPGGGEAWTSTILSVLDRLGVEEKAARQALMRTASHGWLETRREGRRSRWRLTPSARRLLEAGADRIYSFRGAAEAWDGRWLLVAVAPTDGRARAVIRSGLSWAGFGSLRGGLWISPHPERREEALRVLGEAKVAEKSHVFLATREGVGDDRALAGEAWDLDAVEEEYERFMARFGAGTGGNFSTGIDPLAGVVELVHAWRRFPLIDPALPVELLPPRWKGKEAAELFSRRREELLPAAKREWRRLEET